MRPWVQSPGLPKKKIPEKALVKHLNLDEAARGHFPLLTSDLESSVRALMKSKTQRGDTPNLPWAGNH
jgi:hypothetical protein